MEKINIFYDWWLLEHHIVWTYRCHYRSFLITALQLVELRYFIFLFKIIPLYKEPIFTLAQYVYYMADGKCSETYFFFF